MAISSISGVNFAVPVSNIKSPSNPLFKANIKDIGDTLELSGQKELTIKEKQKIIKNARAKAASWSIIGGIFSTLYCAWRSDEKVAKEFYLDPQKDKKLIKQIKHEQTLWTIPGAVLAFPGGIIAYIAAGRTNSKNIEEE